MCQAMEPTPAEKGVTRRTKSVKKNTRLLPVGGFPYAMNRRDALSREVVSAFRQSVLKGGLAEKSVPHTNRGDWCGVWAFKCAGKSAPSPTKARLRPLKNGYGGHGPDKSTSALIPFGESSGKNFGPCMTRLELKSRPDSQGWVRTLPASKYHLYRPHGWVVAQKASLSKAASEPVLLSSPDLSYVRRGRMRPAG